MARAIDLNADLGEATDPDGVEAERALLAVVTTVHVACGGHAGDDESMAVTVQAARRHSVRVGAHPAYPDREGFGRRPMAMARDDLRGALADQLRTLWRACATVGTEVESVKAHGALYEEVAKGGAVYEAFRDAVRDTCRTETMVVLPSGCRATAMALRDGMRAIEEGFCDRAYRGDGGLVPRTEEGALLSEPAAAVRASRESGSRCGGRGRRQRADAVGRHAVRPRGRPGGAGHRHLGSSGHRGGGHRRGRAVACMIRTVPVGEVRPLGDRAVLVGVEDAGAGRALALALHAGGTTFEVVPGEVTVLVARPHDDAEIGALGAVVEQALGSLDAEDAPGEPGRLVTVPCRFDGPDLLEVCAGTGSTPEDVVDLLTRAPLSVAVVGFSPGFAYLHGLPAPLDAVPRRAVPRPVVPAGSVALANGRAAIYPTASPGGWNLVGRTGVPLFFTHRPPYAVLAAGDRVRFTVAGPGDSLEPPAIEPPAWSPTRGSRPVLEVVTPGLRAVVQDGGRRRVVHAGVPQTGPADPDSFDLANRLLHNSPDAGTVELTGGVARLRALAPCHVAVVGAAPDLAVDATPVPPGHVLPLVRDQVLRVRTHARRVPDLRGGGRWRARAHGLRELRQRRAHRLGRGPTQSRCEALGGRVGAAVGRPPAPRGRHRNRRRRWSRGPACPPRAAP